MKAIALVLVATTMFSITASAMETADFYKELADSNGIGVVQEYWTDELTTEIICGRGDSILVEKLIDVCIDDEGNGQIIDPASPDYDYISYASVDGVSEGDVILTVCIYMPGNDYEDDIVDRFDYIIDQQ